MTLMRIVAWNVQPVVMADDGATLTPVTVQPQTILAAHWDAFKAGGDLKALEQMRAQIENPTPANRATRRRAAQTGKAGH